MAETQVTVSCEDCDLRETFDGLATARSFVETHRTETGHDPTWELGKLSSGVERAGEEAGVCGRSGCTTTDSPLYLGKQE